MHVNADLLYCIADLNTYGCSNYCPVFCAGLNNKLDVFMELYMCYVTLGGDKPGQEVEEGALSVW